MEFHYSGNEDKYYENSQQEEKSDYSQSIGGIDSHITSVVNIRC